MALILDDYVDTIPLTPTLAAEGVHDADVHPEWVKIKRAFSRGDELALQRATIGNARAGVVDGGALDMSTVEVNIGDMMEAAEFAALQIAIKSWSFTFNGEPIPVTPENIRKLSAADVGIIKAAIDERNGGDLTAEGKVD